MNKTLIAMLAIVASATTASEVKTLKGAYYVGVVSGNCMVLDELLAYRDKTAGPEERQHVSDFIDAFAGGSGHSVESYKKICKKAKEIGERLEGR